MPYRRFLLLALMTWHLVVAFSVWEAPPGPLPPVQTQGTVTYVSGGIGHEEAQTFVAALTQYPLALEFAVKRQTHQAFIANVHTVVSLPRGHVLLDTWSQGPFLLVKLPPGDYMVSATYGEHTLSHRVRVTSPRPVHMLFLWNTPPPNDAPAESTAKP